MNIAQESGAVKAPLPPIQWTFADHAAALELHCIAKHRVHNLCPFDKTWADFEALYASGRVSAYSHRNSDGKYQITGSDLHDLFHLVVDGIGGWN